MDYIPRLLQPVLEKALKRDKSVLLLGPRQTGKTTLIRQIKTDYSISLVQPLIRQKYEKNPGLLSGEIEAIAEQKKNKPLIVIDEIQKVPILFDVAQDLIDRHIAKFILTGSSARKLRTTRGINLLPGRVVVLHLDSLTISELKNEPFTLEELLQYGSLPGIIHTKNKKDKEIDLHSYVTTYLEEEIRLEAIVRNVGNFSNFLQLACSEAGAIVNLRKLSQIIGVAHTTIASYYQILEDCLIAERIEPLIESKKRRRLTTAPRYLFFDLGIRRLGAEESTFSSTEHLGKLFEQFVGLELIKMARLFDPSIKIKFWRDSDQGPEVDWIIEKDNQYIPVEVKWTATPILQDIKHLKLFLEEYKKAKKAYLVCQVTQKTKLAENIFAISWKEIGQLITS